MFRDSELLICSLNLTEMPHKGTLQLHRLCCTKGGDVGENVQYGSDHGFNEGTFLDNMNGLWLNFVMKTYLLSEISLRVEPAMFNELLNRLGERITKKDTWYRKALDPGLKLAITLCFLATGDSYHTLMYGFRVSHSTISLIVREVCEAINEEFAAEVVQCPTTPHEWKVVADQFGERWQFFHAIGALDGKHVAIKCPRNGGSIYYNYKVSR